jgi:hypothetical protein
MEIVMFNSDLLLAFAFMTLLFLRQIVILKRPNKINYAPLMIGVGSVATLVHFIINPQTQDVVLLLRESVFPLLVALLLYLVMNVLHQTQVSENAKVQDEFSKELIQEILDLKRYILELEINMKKTENMENDSQKEIAGKFNEDLEALQSIQVNQSKFIDKFEKMEKWHTDVNKSFEYFSEVQLPELDAVIHKHIDIFRVSEQDHYNKLISLLEHAVKSREDMSEDIVELQSSINAIKTISKDVATSITKHTLEQLSGVTKAFEDQIIALKFHTEGVTTSLHEGESNLKVIRTQSEIIMKQMLLSSSKMKELQAQNSDLSDVFATLKEIIDDVESVKSDYVKSQAQLSSISKELADSKDEQVQEMREKIDELSKSVLKGIEESLEKLHEHYHIAGSDITQSVQMLAKRAQSKSGYGDGS